MLGVGLSLMACLGWGVADYLGGIKSRHLPVLTVLMISSIFGLGLTCFVVGVQGPVLPNNPVLLFGVVGGAAGTLALLMLYRAMAVGSMAIVAPVSATGVMLPVLVGLAAGDDPSPLQSAGMAAAVIGSILAAREKNANGKTRQVATGIGLAIGAAIFVGIFFIATDRASQVDPLWAAFVVRFSESFFLLLLVLYVRPSLRIGRMHMPAIIWLGIVDSLAGVAYAVATTKGMLSVVAVVGALYPAVTVVLAVLFLKERPHVGQSIGVILAITGIALIAAG